MFIESNDALAPSCVEDAISSSVVLLTPPPLRAQTGPPGFESDSGSDSATYRILGPIPLPILVPIPLPSFGSDSATNFVSDSATQFWL